MVKTWLNHHIPIFPATTVFEISLYGRRKRPGVGRPWPGVDIVGVNLSCALVSHLGWALVGDGGEVSQAPRAGCAGCGWFRVSTSARPGAFGEACV